MSGQTISKSLDYACDILLANNAVRYVGILDNMGNLIYDKKQNGVNLSLSDEKSRSLYIKSVLGVLFEKDFDVQIGSLKYNVSHRTKIDMITIPMFNHVIVISTEPNENCDVIANSAIQIFEKLLKN
ncbi:hypothetical protein SCCGRSA3_02076 [Marine Group I thaumarchaeote SCGC RSA3]|uniref:Roadblock/LAMTOR2 domain-containing protein n=2 Tax=Marine Group I TaxID=905826 RepID=A0A081RMT2_9ARCH|nr:hypothetical protein AAA799N04_00997 [Marine Group I thaumarchaeote SCGC AAA799-N04]KFM16759.1 hypothetical protein SCCGRSA3_02076 [Marine Group I thaumarchaeote SCGC RSA3]